MATNIPISELQRIDNFFVPLKDVFVTLQWHVNSIRPGLQINWFEYVRCMMNYVFDENIEINPTLHHTECRTILSEHGFTDEQMAWVEHNVISIAIMLVGDIHSYIKMLSRANLINGFHWDFNNCRDLIIRISYK